MTNMLFIMCLILVSTGNLAFSQDWEIAGQSKIGFSAGLSHLQVKDKTLNGLVHSGPGMGVAFFYSNSCCNYLQDLEIYGGISFLQSKFETDMETYFLQGALQYSLKRKISRLIGKTDIYLGGQVKIDASQGIYSNWDENHFYWLTSYCLGFNGHIGYQISKKSTASVGLGLPLISMVSRSPEHQYFHEANPDVGYILKAINQNPALQFLTAHFNPELKLSVQSSIGKRFSVSLFWKFSYTYNDMKGSRDLYIINHTVGIGFLF